MKNLLTTGLFLALLTLTACSDLASGLQTLVENLGDNDDSLDDIAPADTVFITKSFNTHKRFHDIQLDGGYTLNVVQGESYSVKFRGRKVFADSARVFVQKGKLYVSATRQRFARGEYTVTMPKLRKVHGNGGLSLNAENFQQSGDVTIKTNGGGDISLRSSSFGNIVIKTNGASNADIRSVLARDIIIKTDGAANINLERITADSLRVSVNGAGSLKASGRCKTFRHKFNGAGTADIEKLQITEQAGK